MGGDLAVRLLRRLRPAPEVVPDLVGREVGRRMPAARLESHDIEAGARQREGRNAARGAKTDDDDVRWPLPSRHGV